MNAIPFVYVRRSRAVSVDYHVFSNRDETISVKRSPHFTLAASYTTHSIISHSCYQLPECERPEWHEGRLDLLFAFVSQLPSTLTSLDIDVGSSVCALGNFWREWLAPLNRLPLLAAVNMIFSARHLEGFSAKLAGWQGFLNETSRVPGTSLLHSHCTTVLTLLQYTSRSVWSPPGGLSLRRYISALLPVHYIPCTPRHGHHVATCFVCVSIVQCTFMQVLTVSFAINKAYSNSRLLWLQPLHSLTTSRYTPLIIYATRDYYLRGIYMNADGKNSSKFQLAVSRFLISSPSPRHNMSWSRT